jgi:signal transduction histidine kinase/sugar phosphate isomerase/epimerase
MKVGIQTILWGTKVPDLAGMLGQIASYGFQGVEFAQSPRALPTLPQLLSLLETHNLELVGLAGGTLRERVAYCGDFRPNYLYVDTWDETEGIAALEAGFTLALHPHLFKNISRLANAVKLLQQYRPKYGDRIRLLPDTAHMYIAGDDPAAAIQKHKDVLAGVHLKDWTGRYGRSYHRYARGFVELGRGEVGLDAALKELRPPVRCPWLVVELDTSSSEQSETLRALAEWLADRGLRPRPVALSRPPVAFPAQIPEASQSDLGSAMAELQLIWSFFKSAYLSAGEFYHQAAEMFARLLKADGVAIASCNELYGFMALLANWPPEEKIVPRTVAWENSVSVPAVESLEVQVRNLPHEKLTEHSPFRDKLREYRRFISVPVLNTWTIYHVRGVINIFSVDPYFAAPTEMLERMARAFGIAADRMLDNQCSSAAVEMATLAEKSQSVKGFIETARGLLERSLACDVVSVFLADEEGKRLKATPGSPVTWGGTPIEERFYRPGEGLTGKVWQENEAVLTTKPEREPSWKGKSVDESGRELDQYLIAPIRTQINKSIGVVRCARDSRQGGAMFTDDDLAILDAVCQVAVPHLRVLHNREATAETIARVAHELSNPVSAIRGAAQFMDQEIREKGYDPSTFFRKDFMDDIFSWTDLMKRLLLSTRFVGGRALLSTQLQKSPTLLLKDVILPAVRQARMLLLEREFSPELIDTVGNFGIIPRIDIDRNLFQQVFFNLFSNAIKYAYADPEAFSVQIEADRTASDYLIYFRDWGPGIPEELWEKIFEEGFRLPSVKDLVIGQGLGLAVARQAVEAHGGTIQVTNGYLPTEFTIRLPIHKVRPGSSGWPSRRRMS